MRSGPLAVLAILLSGCPDTSSPPSSADGGPAPDAAPPPFEPPLGGSYEPDGRAVWFRVAAPRAERVEVAIFATPTGAAETLRVPLVRDGDLWSVRVAVEELPEVVYYGYRVWGPSWRWDPSWTPGSDAGFVARVTA